MYIIYHLSSDSILNILSYNTKIEALVWLTVNQNYIKTLSNLSLKNLIIGGFFLVGEFIALLP